MKLSRSPDYIYDAGFFIFQIRLERGAFGVYLGNDLLQFLSRTALFLQRHFTILLLGLTLR
jgi:hypothetical protein